MMYRVILLHPDGSQENYTTEAPNYDRLQTVLEEGCIQSFTVTKA